MYNEILLHMHKKICEINLHYRMLKTMQSTKINSQWPRVPHIDHFVGKIVLQTLELQCFLYSLVATHSANWTVLKEILKIEASYEI